MFNPAIAAVAKRNKIIRRFRAANATVPERAIDPFILGLRHGLVFKKLVVRGILVETTRNLFYLDEARELTFNASRRKITLLLLAILLVALTLHLYFSK